jgi:hypothetical protein
MEAFMGRWACWALMFVTGCTCLSEEAPPPSATTTEVVPRRSLPSVMPRTAALRLSAGSGYWDGQPLIGLPYLLEASASAGDTGHPAVVTSPPTLELFRPDGRLVEGPIVSIPIRVTGTLDGREEQPDEEMFLRAQWLFPASVTATFSPGVHVATVRWAGNTHTQKLAFRQPDDAAKATKMAALTLCEAGRTKKDPVLMMSGLDAGFAVAPRNTSLSLCLADALKAQGKLAEARRPRRAPEIQVLVLGQRLREWTSSGRDQCRSPWNHNARRGGSRGAPPLRCQWALLRWREWSPRA